MKLSSPKLKKLFIFQEKLAKLENFRFLFVERELFKHKRKRSDHIATLFSSLENFVIFHELFFVVFLSLLDNIWLINF